MPRRRETPSTRPPKERATMRGRGGSRTLGGRRRGEPLSRLLNPRPAGEPLSRRLNPRPVAPPVRKPGGISPMTTGLHPVRPVTPTRRIRGGGRTLRRRR